ncbi:MAG: ABC transporter permease subunit [Phycisphaeraceae bacterium]|nr:MAG: ABC transporter permease subunit [Phycisphaeraceae bacterium]
MNPNLSEQLNRLPDLLGNHLLLVLTSLLIGAAISVPLAVLSLRVRWLRGPVLAVASVVQTIPSLAILALMVAAFGMFGRVPAIVALSAYSVLPILRNTVTGILGVDANVVEAARGIGMTGRQVLWRVQLPLAAPVIIAGVRTAAVWVVGIATLSTPVGARSLGNYIFSGLQTLNFTAVLVGVFAAAGLALLLDGLIRLGEVAVARRSRGMGMAAIAGALVIVVGGMLPLFVELQRSRGVVAALEGDRGERFQGRVVIGAKTFTEQFILARVIAQTLEEAGYRVEINEGLGSIVVFEALLQGRIDAYVDYSGTIWVNNMGREDVPDPTTMLFEMTAWLAGRGVLCLGPLGFENAYALAMRRDVAERLGVEQTGDLEAHASGLRIGSDYEFFERPEWRAFRRGYGLEFAEEVAFDSTLMYPAVSEGRVDVITAFTTDGRIDAFDLSLIRDEARVFPAYDAVLLLGETAAMDGTLVDALRGLVGSIDDAMMRRANARVDMEGETLDGAAGRLREELREGG